MCALSSDSETRTFIRDLSDFISGLANEGERALVIGGAARVEVALEHLIRTVMLPCPGDRDELFEGVGALSSFYAKIGMAYRLGLLEDKLERMLQLVRKVRNDFAHATVSVSLSESSHQNRLNEIKKCVQNDQIFRLALKSFLENAKLNTAPPKIMLASALIAAAVSLEVAAEGNKPATVRKAMLDN